MADVAPLAAAAAPDTTSRMAESGAATDPPAPPATPPTTAIRVPCEETKEKMRAWICCMRFWACIYGFNPRGWTDDDLSALENALDGLYAQRVQLRTMPTDTTAQLVLIDKKETTLRAEIEKLEKIRASMRKLIAARDLMKR